MIISFFWKTGENYSFYGFDLSFKMSLIFLFVYPLTFYFVIVIFAFYRLLGFQMKKMMLMLMMKRMSLMMRNFFIFLEYLWISSLIFITVLVIISLTKSQALMIRIQIKTQSWIFIVWHLLLDHFCLIEAHFLYF